MQSNKQYVGPQLERLFCPWSIVKKREKKLEEDGIHTYSKFWQKAEEGN